MKSSTEQERGGERRREEERGGERRREQERAERGGERKRGGYSPVGITWMMQRDDTPLRNSPTDAGEGRMKQRDRTEEKVRLLFQDNKKKRRKQKVARRTRRR